MDSVHQIWQQHPNEFEFNLELLNELAYHAYTGIFGNFIMDNYKSRFEFALKTTSIWSYIMEYSQRYTNLLYSSTKQRLTINFSVISLRIWKEHFIKGTLLHKTFKAYITVQKFL